jgi:hypothetical protein
MVVIPHVSLLQATVTRMEGFAGGIDAIFKGPRGINAYWSLFCKRVAQRPFVRRTWCVTY